MMNTAILLDGCPLLHPFPPKVNDFVSLADGTLREKRSLGSKVWSSPAGGKDVMYVGTFDGKMLALALP